MRHGALLNLLTRRLTIGFAVLGVGPAVMVPFLDPAGEPKAVALLIGFSVYMCAMSGGFLGQRFVMATGCSFAWTLPRFRRDVLWELVACGIAVSTVPGLIVTVTAGAMMSALLASVVGFAAFSVGGALSMIPEAQAVLPLGWFAFMWFPTSFPSSVLDAPLIVIPITLAISAVALSLGFGGRTFRWLSLNSRQGPVGSISYQLHTVLRLPKRRPRRAGACPESGSRAPYVGTAVVRGVAYSYQAIRGRRWLFGNLTATVILFALITAGSKWLNLITEGPAASPNLWFGLVVIGCSLSFFDRRGCSRLALPWSRRQHLAVAYTLDLFDTLGFLLATCPIAVAVFILVAHPDLPSIGAMARAGAATAVFLPVFQWRGGPPTGEPGLGQLQAMSAVVLVRPVAIVAAVTLVVYGLPTVVASIAAQAIVLGLVLVASQALYWLKLRHAFTTRDLVGEAT